MTETIEHRQRVTLSGAVDSVDLVVGRHNRIVVQRPVLWRPQAAPMVARPQSCLVLPGPWNRHQHPIPVVLAAMHRAAELRQPMVLMIGHDSPERSLGEQRCASLRQLLAGDESGWVRSTTDFAGLMDVHGYLDYLDRRRGWSSGIEIVDGLDNEASAEAVTRFQQQCNERFDRELLEDGICGEQTLGAMFGVVRHELQRWLDKHGLSSTAFEELDVRWLTAPVGTTVRGGFDGAAGSAALDVLVGERERVDESGLTGELVYGSPVATFEPISMPREKGGWEFGEYTVISDITDGETMVPERYLLKSTDGRYERELVLPDDAVDTGLLELHYEGLPTDASFSLHVCIEDVGEYTVFENLSYPDLHLQAVADEANEEAY